MRELKISTAANLMVFMTDSADHVSGKTGLTLTITASKDGGAFGSITPTVTERGSGWYSLALTAGHTDTLGDLALHVTASGADPTDLVCRVIAMDKTVANTPAAVNTIANDAIKAATIEAAALNNKGNWNVGKTGYSLTQSFPSNFASLAIDASGHVVLQDASLVTAKLGTFALAKSTNITGFNDLDAAGIRTAVGMATANLDTQLSGLPTASGIADAVWTEAIADHSSVSGSVAEALAAAGASGDPWITNLPGSYTGSQAGKVIGDISAAVAGAISEITGIADAPATPTLKQAVMLVYMWLRNDTQATSAERRIFNDAGTEILDATMADNGTTFSQGKLTDA